LSPGVFASYAVGSRVFSGITGGQGVRAIPRLAQGLDVLGKSKKTARLSIMIERGLNSFAVLGGVNQFKSDSTSIKERSKMLGGDALVATIFPVADEISMIAKLGKASVPVAGAAMFSAGAIGADTWEEAVVNGSALTAMWMISRGASIKQAKQIRDNMVSSIGDKNPNVVSDLKAMSDKELLAGARALKEKQVVADAIRRTAQAGSAKATAGQKLLPSEQIAMSKVLLRDNIRQAFAKHHQLIRFRAWLV